MNGFDLAIARALAGFVNRWPAFDHALGTLVNVDLVKGGVLFALVWWVWFAHDGDPAARRRIVLATLAGCLVAVAVARGLALALPHRPRPMIAFGAEQPPGARWIEWSSFPSDHAALFFALGVGLWGYSRRLAIAALAYVAVGVCVPRVYVGLHYATDMLAGAALGVGFGILFARPALRDRLARPALRWHDTHLASFYTALFALTYQLATLFGDLRRIGVLLIELARGAR
jgi:undecaprenyl-diphosphatase